MHLDTHYDGGGLYLVYNVLGQRSSTLIKHLSEYQ